jgi:hypothetical protein
MIGTRFMIGTQFMIITQIYDWTVPYLANILGGIMKKTVHSGNNSSSLVSNEKIIPYLKEEHFPYLRTLNVFCCHFYQEEKSKKFIQQYGSRKIYI